MSTRTGKRFAATDGHDEEAAKAYDDNSTGSPSASDDDSSSEENQTRKGSTRHHGKNYTIDLRAFHKTKRRLETELRNKETANDILDVYCSDGKQFEKINPLTGGQGSFPLIKLIYKHTRSGNYVGSKS